jgi:Transposase DDE domain
MLQRSFRLGGCRASKLDCDVCPLKLQCCPKEPSRKIPRDIHEHARDVARSFAGTEGFEQSRRERKKIEMRFAHLKRILRLGRLRLRGPRGGQDLFWPPSLRICGGSHHWSVGHPPLGLCASRNVRVA